MKRLSTPLNLINIRHGVRLHCWSGWLHRRCLLSSRGCLAATGYQRLTALVRHTGRPTREESGEITPKVKAAITLSAAGYS